MSKSAIIASACSALLLSAAPAFAQTPTLTPAPKAPATINLGSLGKVDVAPTAGHARGFGGRHGSAVDLRDAAQDSAAPDSTSSPGSCPAGATAHVKVFSGRDFAAVDSQGSAGVDSRQGSGVLRQPSQESAPMRPATLYVRKAGDDKRQDEQPLPGASGITKTGAGRLEVQPGDASAATPHVKAFSGNTGGVDGEQAPRARQQNNLRQMGLANSCD